MGPWQSAWWVEASPNSPNLRARISVHSLELVTRLKAGQSFYTNSRWFCESGRVIFFRWCIYQYLSLHIICFEFAFRWCLCPYLFHHLGEARGKASKIQQRNRCSQASRHCVSRSPSCGFSNASKPWQLAVRNQQQPWLMARRLSMIWRQARFLCDLLLRHYGL